MTYNKTNDNLFHDHNNIYKYSLSQKGKGGKETNLSNLISEQEMETLQNKEVTLEIKLSDTRLTPHAYPLVTYKTENLSQLAEGILKLSKEYTQENTGLHIIDKSQQSDIIVYLTCVRTLKESRNLHLHLKDKQAIIDKLIDTLGLEEVFPAPSAETNNTEEEGICAPSAPSAPQVPPELEELLTKDTSDTNDPAESADTNDTNDTNPTNNNESVEQVNLVDIPLPPIPPELDI